MDIAVSHRALGDGVRARDEQDFLALLPVVSGPQRSWLRETLAEVRPGHPWLARLSPAATHDA